MEVLALLANPDLPSHFDKLQVSSGTLGSDPHAEPGTRQRQVRLSTTQVNQLTTRYQAGASVRELVREFGINRTTVLKHLERRNVTRRVNHRKLTDHDVQVAAQYYQAGESLQTVGNRFNVYASTIRREFVRAGIETRPRN